MDKTFKTVVLWSLYIGVIIVSLFTLILLGVNVLAPTFFPKTDISGIKEYINTFCVILSFLSVGLGFYSIWQANTSDKRADEILKSVQSIEREQHLSQQLMHVITTTVDNCKIIKTDNSNSQNAWKPDSDTN